MTGKHERTHKSAARELLHWQTKPKQRCHGAKQNRPIQQVKLQVCVSGSCRLENNPLKTIISTWAMTSAQIRWNLSENNNLTACRKAPKNTRCHIYFQLQLRAVWQTTNFFLIISTQPQTRRSGLQKKTPHCFQGNYYNLSQDSSRR